MFLTAHRPTLLALSRWVLVWFALSLGVAIASPLVRPQALELLCSGAGPMKLRVVSDDGGTAPTAQMLDCPLCAQASAPPRAATAAAAPALSQTSPALAAQAPRLALPTAALPPPRGPPQL